MNTSLSWIKAYVPELSCGDKEYCDAMTLSGTKVEGYTPLKSYAKCKARIFLGVNIAHFQYFGMNHAAA